MERKQRLLDILRGFFLGVILTAAVWFCVSLRPDVAADLEPSDGNFIENTETDASYFTDVQNRDSANQSNDLEAEDESSDILSIAAGEWDNAAVYTGGDIVLYQGYQYRAKWWT